MVRLVGRILLCGLLLFSSRCLVLCHQVSQRISEDMDINVVDNCILSQFKFDELQPFVQSVP